MVSWKEIKVHKISVSEIESKLGKSSKVLPIAEPHGWTNRTWAQPTKLTALVPNLDPRALLLTERERRAMGNPETKCLLIGFREEQSKASLNGAFM